VEIIPLTEDCAPVRGFYKKNVIAEKEPI